MNNITYTIQPADEPNDFQVRLQIDGIDHWGNDYLGVDPPVFFKQKGLLDGGEVVYGRCACGVMGCDDLIAQVSILARVVEWLDDSGRLLRFDKSAYTELVQRGRSDTSWENPSRRMERKISKLFEGTVFDRSYKFEWASSRFEEENIVLSFARNVGTTDYSQKFLRIKWDSKDEDATLANADTLAKNLNQTLQNRLKILFIIAYLFILLVGEHVGGPLILFLPLYLLSGDLLAMGLATLIITALAAVAYSIYKPTKWNRHILLISGTILSIPIAQEFYYLYSGNTYRWVNTTPFYVSLSIVLVLYLTTVFISFRKQLATE